MGGGGGDVPESPDYSDIIDAAMEGSEWSFSNAQEMMDWAKKAYEENKGISDDVIKNALGWMTKQGEWAEADRQRWEDVYKPLEDKLAAEAAGYSTQQRQEMEAGKAEADVAAQFAQARQAAQDRLEAMASTRRRHAGAHWTWVREWRKRQPRRLRAIRRASQQPRHRSRSCSGRRSTRAAVTTNRAQAEAAGSGTFGNQAINTGLATTASGAPDHGHAAAMGRASGTRAWARRQSMLKNTQFMQRDGCLQRAQAQAAVGVGPLAPSAGTLPMVQDDGVPGGR